MSEMQNTQFLFTTTMRYYNPHIPSMTSRIFKLLSNFPVSFIIYILRHRAKIALSELWLESQIK